MKQQVVAIHGGTSFDSQAAYLAFLKTRELTLEKLTHPDDWKATLARALGDDYEVLLPKMPNGTNARYGEWCLWLVRCELFMQDDVILIGHSLGGIFLAKYLSEHVFTKRIKATIIVGAPFDDTATQESLTDFSLPASLAKLVDQGGAIYLIHSEDDPVVPFSQMEKYQQALPAAKTLRFSDRGHFNQAVFPELVALIQSL